MWIASIIRTVRNDLRSDTVRGRMVRSAMTTTFLKVLAALLAFLSNLFYARLLGVYGYGMYAFVAAWVAIVAAPTGLGFPQYLVREGAKNEQWLIGMRRYADSCVFLAGVVAAIFLVVVACSPFVGRAQWLFVVAAPLPLLTNLGLVRQSLLQAQGLIARSYWVKFLFSPGAVFVVVYLLWVSGITLSPFLLMLIVVVVALISLWLSSIQLNLSISSRQSPPFKSFNLKASMPFMWLGAAYILVNRVELILLGVLGSKSEAGLYAVASRSTDMLIFIGMAAVTTAAPKFASLYHEGKLDQMQRLISALGKRLLLLTIPPVLVLMVFPETLLSFFYGSEYAGGGKVLQLLGTAQFFAVVCGPLGTLLNMTGNERFHLYGVGLAFMVNIVLGFLLIPLSGAEGAAIATCISILSSRVLLSLLVRRKLGLRASFLGL